MYRAMRRWLCQHPRLVDGTLAAPLFLSSIVTGVYTVPHDVPWWMALLVAAGICGPFAIRRQRPALVFAIAVLAAFAQWLLDMGLLPADLVLFAGLYNVASRCRWEFAAAAAAVLEGGAALAIARWVAGPDMWVNLIMATVLIASVWVWGSSVRTRRAYLASLEERAVRLERERDNQAQITAAAERARIAREMHDVVSHSISVMVVQADGAAYAIETDPGRAQQALATISTIGRTAQSEMRRTLGVLREESPSQEEGFSPEYAPQPGIAQLDQLVQQVRRSGLAVRFTVEGAAQELPVGMELAVYRVAQEALTNTLKHAGPRVSGAQVHLRYGDGMLELRVADDGPGAAVLSGEPPGGEDQQGHGLIGMRERVAAYGGSVRSGPRTRGGFEVVASLPLRQASVS